MFAQLYQWILRLAGHRFAVYWLGFIGFIEAIIFPIPADIMLAPMCLGKRTHAYRYALVLSICSVAGGICGYYLGHLFTEEVGQFITYLGQEKRFASFRKAFNEWGVALVFASGFSPFPYKVAALSAGIIPIAFPLFLIGSLLSRPLRFFLIAWAITKSGEKLEKIVLRYIEWLGWVCLILLVIIAGYLYNIKG